MEKDLALDAAIRKKLGYEQLPEPAAKQTVEQREEWQKGVFVSEDSVIESHITKTVNVHYFSNV